MKMSSYVSVSFVSCISSKNNRSCRLGYRVRPASNTGESRRGGMDGKLFTHEMIIFCRLLRETVNVSTSVDSFINLFYRRAVKTQGTL